MSKVNEVVIKVESQSDYVSAFGVNKDSVIDMSKSTFSFEPQWSSEKEPAMISLLKQMMAIEDSTKD
jgi:hypothetical protein